ncbi:MAG: hypothetical protein M1399_03245 [Actinobacteria bacterium]|nr:hypothetical protein [Actinomycetota bacterium]MCL5446487.1 hypothetical protein [Actinomycetota bacterium]
MTSLPSSSSAEDLIRSGPRLDQLTHALEQAQRSLAEPLTEQRRQEGWTEDRKMFVVSYVDEVAHALDEHKLRLVEDRNWMRDGVFDAEWGMGPYAWQWNKWADVVLGVSNALSDYQQGEQFLRKVLSTIKALESGDDEGVQRDQVKEKYVELQVLVLLLHGFAEKLLDGLPISWEDLRAFHDAVLPIGAGYSWFDPDDGRLGAGPRIDEASTWHKAAIEEMALEHPGDLARFRARLQELIAEESARYFEQSQIPSVWTMIGELHGNCVGMANNDEAHAKHWSRL